MSLVPIKKKKVVVARCSLFSLVIACSSSPHFLQAKALQMVLTFKFAIN